MPPDAFLDEDASAGATTSQVLGYALQDLGKSDAKKPVKEKRKLRQMWAEFQAEHGKGAVVVLGDLAVRTTPATGGESIADMSAIQDMHEKVAK
jgi:hypothetical protein